jgi:hypothetical protein
VQLHTAAALPIAGLHTQQSSASPHWRAGWSARGAAEQERCAQHARSLLSCKPCKRSVPGCVWQQVPGMNMCALQSKCQHSGACSSQHSGACSSQHSGACSSRHINAQQLQVFHNSAYTASQ